MRQIIPLLCLAGAMVFVACSNKDETDEKNGDKIVMSAAQFTLTEEPYGEETEVETRAAEVLPTSATNTIRSRLSSRESVVSVEHCEAL